jgi:hypothetical protein
MNLQTLALQSDRVNRNFERILQTMRDRNRNVYNIGQANCEEVGLKYWSGQVRWLLNHDFGRMACWVTNDEHAYYADEKVRWMR